MSNLRSILHEIATKANEEKKNKNSFLLHLQEQIISAAKEGNFRITLTHRHYIGHSKVLIVIPETVTFDDVKEFFNDSGFEYLKYQGNGGLEMEIDWGN